MRNVKRLLVLVAAIGSANAQTPTIFASGLSNPSRAIIGPNNTLLVTESTTTPSSGRVSLLDTGGNRRTIIDGLPSGPAAPDYSADGPNGLALNGRTLYIGIGEGDGHVNGPTPGTIVANPKGPSSPMFATILKVVFSNDLDKLASGFSLKPADHFTLMDGATMTYTNTSGDTAAVSVLSMFRVNRPDPATIYRNTHIYSMTLMPSQPNALYVADAGNNAIWQVDLTTGRSPLLIRFPSVPNPVPGGAPVIEAVPTSVHLYGSQLLVTLLSGAPFLAGQSTVMTVDPTSAATTIFMGGLSSSIDSAFRTRTNGAGQWFVLEYSLQPLTVTPAGPGRLLMYNTATPQVLADGLNTPVGIVLNESTNDLFIVDRTDGTVSRINVGS